MTSTNTEGFRSAMGHFGLLFAGEIVADGKLHRFKCGGDAKQNCWYVFHADPPAAGAFGCWKRGLHETWCSGNGDVSQTEWNTIRRRWQESERERDHAESEARDRARKTAEWIFGRAEPVARHVYLTSKGVMAFGELRQWRGALVVPLRDVEGKLHSVQLIAADGAKRFLTGGCVAGCFYSVGDGVGPLVVCEGVATGASIHQATGYATLAAMHCGNLLAVAQALRAKWPEREVIIAADNDQFTGGNPGLTKATEAAKAISARLAVPQFTSGSTKPTDFNDLHQLEGPNAVKKLIEMATVPKENDEQAYVRLARLSPADYDRWREPEAKKLEIRVGTLDAEVAKRRPKTNTNENTRGGALEFPDFEAWPEPVIIAQVLEEIVNAARRYIVAAEAALIALALYVVHTYVFDLGDISPLLIVSSPTKRCGKSRLLTLLQRLVHRPLAVSSASPAGIYRAIELFRPTLLIDEVDTFLKGDEQLRGLINAGHTRDAAYHLGCVAVGDDFQPRRWSTWAPKVLSGIGHLADTLEDRAVIITMRRRKKDEPVERLRYRTHFEDLCRKIVRWVADNEGAIRRTDPGIPEALHDRAADNWTPLLVIADLAGSDWPGRARRAALELSGLSGTTALGHRVQLLADIRDIFAQAGSGRLPSADLCQRLAAIEGRPWAEFGDKKKPISANQLAKQLAEFGITPDSVRIGDKTPKGYNLSQFDDAFERYVADVPSISAFQNATTQQRPACAAGNNFLQSATNLNVAVPQKAVSPQRDGQCCGVAVQNAELTALTQADLL